MLINAKLGLRFHPNEIDTDWDAFALEHFGIEPEPDRNDDPIDRVVLRLSRELGHAGYDAAGNWQWDDKYHNEERHRFASEWHRPIDWEAPVPVSRPPVYVPSLPPRPAPPVVYSARLPTGAELQRMGERLAISLLPPGKQRVAALLTALTGAQPSQRWLYG